MTIICKRWQQASCCCLSCCLYQLTPHPETLDPNPRASALAGPDERVLARQQGLVGLGAGVPVLDTSQYPFSAIGLLIANEAFNITTGRVWTQALGMHARLSRPDRQIHACIAMQLLGKSQ